MGASDRPPALHRRQPQRVRFVRRLVGAVPPPITAQGALEHRVGDTTRMLDTWNMAAIRPARIEDVAAILAIDPESLGRAEDIAVLVRCESSLLAVEDATIVGFAGVKPGHFYGRDFLDLLFVGSAHRRQGVGRSLVRAVVERATTTRVFTSTNESNAAMRSLLASESWSQSGVLVGLDEGDPEHIFFRDSER
jgi:GNAT superfamily N-acetyltransferase